MHDAELEQRLLAILAADAAGYSRLMADDERSTVSALDAARAVFRRCIESNRGRVIDMAGDSVLAVFPTAIGAVASALAIQESLGTLEEKRPAERRMRFRVGLHIGDVIEKSDGTVYGGGINIASRLQALAEPGSIVVSDAIRAAVRGRVGVAFVDRGEQAMKNIPQPVRAYSLAAASGRQQDLPENSYPPAGEPRSVGARPDPKLRENLPASLTTVFGRADDLAALRELIDQHRLVSIVGPGGIGKTTLAQHLTANTRGNYRHGVCWIELATIANEEDLPAAIASAVGVRMGDGEPLDGLCDALRPLVMLVALDNVEHIVECVARMVHAVLDEAPGLRFLVTSQAPLKLLHERVYQLGSLATPVCPTTVAEALNFGAVALFTERAQAAQNRFSLNEANVSAVIDLCRQLDGLPLAIELAAARAPALGVQTLAASMGDRFKLLTRAPNRLAPARQQTLRAALEWSHGFLNEQERAVFRRLAVFAGSASLSMVRDVVVDLTDEGDLDEWAVLDALALLAERSLIVAIINDDGHEPRYRLLETTRAFALEKLRASNEEARLRQRHGHAVAAYFMTARRAMDSGKVRLDAWRHALAPDLDNGREALGWARSADDGLRFVQIATVIGSALPPSAHREQAELARESLPLVERIDDAEMQGVLCVVVSLALGSREPRRAMDLIRRCVARLPTESATDTDAVRSARLLSLCVLARAEVHAGELSSAEKALVAARELVDLTSPSNWQQRLAWTESIVAAARGDSAAGLRWARHRVALLRSVGERDVPGRIDLIDAELAAGDPATAIAAASALLAELAGGRDERSLAYCRLLLGAGHLRLGDPEQAGRHLRAGWLDAPLFNLEPAFADYVSLLAALEGRFELAARLAGYADARNADRRRERNEADAITRVEELARAALGETTFDELRAEGLKLSAAEIETLAFGPASDDSDYATLASESPPR